MQVHSQPASLALTLLLLFYAGGGLYWPVYNSKTHQVEDQKGGRDYMRGGL